MPGWKTSYMFSWDILVVLWLLFICRH